jgi:signal transduction histidine kinase
MSITSFSSSSAQGLGPSPLPRRAEPAATFAAGLAALAAARTVGDVYRRACGLGCQIPRVVGAAVLRQDERGLLGLAYTPAGASLASSVVAHAADTLHQRWIAAHGPGTPEHGFVPFADDERPDLLIAPLVHSHVLIGGLILATDDEFSLSAGDLTAVAAVAVVASTTLVGLGMRHRIGQSVSRADQAAKLTEARKQIARELHDGPAQDLALAGLALDRLVMTLGADQAIAADARQARDLIDRAVLGMRKAVGKLRAPTPPAPSITGPLRALLAEMAPGAAGLEVDFASVSGVQLAPEVERAVVGIVREALHNVRKHAQAETVRLEVRRGAEGMEVAVVDDGVGFAGGAPPDHFGLEQIRELAEGTGGRLEIGSRAGEGTAVRAWIPLAKGTTERLGRGNRGPKLELHG